jgi:hypothetical protein
MRQPATTVTEPDQDAANILLQTPTITATTPQPYARLQTADSGPPARYLRITYTRSPDELLAEWRRHGHDALPERTGVIAVGTHTGAADVADNASPAGAAAPTIKTVATPTDLSGLSTTIHEFCTTWGATDGQFRICFESLTPLLVYVSVDRAARFLQTVTTQVDARGATAHYHLTPSVHAAETVRRLTDLFDAVINLTESGVGTDSPA